MESVKTAVVVACGMARAVRDFFVQWFLPVHLPEDPVREDPFEESDEPVPAPAEAVSVKYVPPDESETELHPIQPFSEPEPAPVITPPGENVVARGSAPQADEQNPFI